MKKDKLTEKIPPHADHKDSREYILIVKGLKADNYLNKKQ